MLLKLYGRDTYTPLSQEAQDNLLKNLATTEGFERLPDFLQQCADSYRNHYLYTGDLQYKGSVLSMVQLRERILEHRKTKKSLTKDAKIGKVKPVY